MTCRRLSLIWRRSSWREVLDGVIFQMLMHFSEKAVRKRGRGISGDLGGANLCWKLGEFFMVDPEGWNLHDYTAV